MNMNEMNVMRRAALAVALMMVATMQLMAADRVDSIRQQLFNRDQSSVLVASHRGDWRNFPENSLEGIDNAIKMGVDIVEIDLQRTRDGVLILMHDATLNRTTTGKGRIADVDYDSIAHLRLRNGCAIATHHRVPTLEQVLLLAKGRVMLNLDKADRYFDQVYALAKQTGTLRQIIMKGKKSAGEVKRQFGSYLDDVVYMPIVNLDAVGAEQRIAEFTGQLKPVAFELLYKSDTNPIPLRLKQTLDGKALRWYNTLWDTQAGAHDDDASLRDPALGYGYLIDTLGANILQTDRPQRLLDYLRSRHLHR